MCYETNHIYPLYSLTRELLGIYYIAAVFMDRIRSEQQNLSSVEKSESLIYQTIKRKITPVVKHELLPKHFLSDCYRTSIAWMVIGKSSNQS